MKFLLLLFIATIALGQTVCGTIGSDRYVLIDVEVTGNLIGNPAADTTVDITPYYYEPYESETKFYANVCGLPVSTGETLTTGNCPKTISFTVEQILAHTAKITICLLADNTASNAVYDYNMAVGSEVPRGYCLKVRNAVTKYYYSGVCYQNTAQFDQKFTVIEKNETLIYKPLINRITDTIYVDAFTSSEIRPEIALILNSDNTLGPNTEGSFAVSLAFTGEKSLGLNFVEDDFIFSGKVLVSTFEKTASFTIRTGYEDTPKKEVLIEKFDCTNAGEYPVLITRVHNGNTLREVFSLTNSEGMLVGDTVDVDNQSATGWGRYLRNSGSALKGLVAEYAVCLASGDYTLEMYALTNDNERTANSWASDSYVTFSTLSEQREGETAYTGYVVGDLAFTSSTGSKSDIITIHLGPVECANNQRVVVFDKLATTRGGTEGFEIYKRDESTGHYSELALIKYYGLANFQGGRFDPYFRVFLCLDQSSYRIRLRNKQRGNSPCTAWSTTSSVEKIEFTKLDGSTINDVHPSMFKASILSSNTYYGGHFNLDSSKEGEYYSVLNNPAEIPAHSEDIKSDSDCYFDFDLFVVQTAAFTVYDSITKLNDKQTITKFVRDVSELNLKCTLESDECIGIVGYTMECSASSNFEQNTPCSSYGISLPDPIENVKQVDIAGEYRSRNEGKFYIKFTPIVEDTEKYIATPKYVYVNLVMKAPCLSIVTKQDKEFIIDAFDVTIDDITCVDENGKVLNKNTIKDSQYTVRKEGDNFIVSFSISSYEHFTCSVDDTHYTVFVQPSCGDEYNIPSLGSLLPLTTTSYEEICDEETDTISERYCAYNSIIKRASIVSMVSVCHRNRFFGSDIKIVPEGHSYTKVAFYVEDRNGAVQYNIVPSSFWFKEQLLFALTEVSDVPVRDVYITKIDFVPESENYGNLLEIIFETQYESANDAQNMFYEPLFINNLNAKLLETTSYFWSVYKLVVGDALSKATPAMCYPVKDTNVEFDYYANPDDTNEQIAIVPEIEYPKTILHYYGYSNFAAPSGTIFDGAITRYCKAKYYQSLFKDYTTNSYVQYFPTTTNKWSDLHLKIVIENMDPRGASSEIRYALARAFARFLGHMKSYYGYRFEYFDINVFMIKGEVPDENQVQIFRDTAFYTELRFRDMEQKDYYYGYLKEYIFNTYYVEGPIKESMSNAVLTFINYFVGKSFKIDNKVVRIYLLHDSQIN
ncbi:hypothetical protein WA158_001978 [Blastocystis sp. Blastoise]